MSSIVSSLTGGGDSGVNFKAQSAPILSPVTKEQADAAQAQSLAALQQQQGFLQATQAQNGLGNQSNVFNQYGQIAAGNGPNPAQAMLANSTGQNVANQAAMMAAKNAVPRSAASQGGAR